MPRYFVPTAALPDDGAPKGSALVTGDLVGERFRIVKRLGAGAMGVVYRALDEKTGEHVAMKVLHQAAVRTGRFAREVAALSELSHPAIVRYVAHGSTPGGSSYLAMELLEGTTLSERLDGEPLPYASALVLARQLAEGLALAHARGIVHRDVKPSNLFLVGGDIERVKILDFGIARPIHDPDGLTHTGSMVGTPGYMAPEQVRGARHIDARADVFALGCVLYECFTGSPAFYAHDILALLSRILFDEPRPVREIVPTLPAALQAVLARMLEKEPARRPDDARAVVEALAACEEGPTEIEATYVDPPTLSGVLAAPRPMSDAPPSVGPLQGELRVTSVVVALGALAWPDGSPVSARDGGGSPRAERAGGSSSPPPSPARGDESGTGPRLVPDDHPRLSALRRVAQPFGARVEGLVDGTVVATIGGSGAAVDRAGLAARCALAMRRVLPESPMSLATGRGDAAGPVPFGDAMDRAAELARVAAKAGRAWATLPPIRVDATTAGLLDARFELAVDGDTAVLQAERESLEPVRTLLGRPTPCVGRERELGELEDLVRRAIQGQTAEVALVTGPTGIGKSRLASELLRRVRAHLRCEAWHARGEPMRTSSPFSLLAQTVRRAAGLLDSESLFVRQHKLRARVDKRVVAGDAQRITEFLGELVGAPFGEERSVQLRAARRDPVLMGDQIRRAWQDWLAAECAARPVILVLDDLQWADAPSVDCLDVALKNLAGCPLVVLGLARPEIADAFPRLWAGRRRLDLPLAGLADDAARALASSVLGELPSGTAAWLVQNAQGNPLWLEELIRAVADGKTGEFSGTLLAMVQARLEALPPETRRVLRAAAVFGDVFSEEGVRALLGGAEQAPDVAATLDDLCERELCTRREAVRRADDFEYTFRHALVHQAAYASLTEADRKLGHAVAGAWLERTGEVEAGLLARHFERAGEPAAAARWYARAAAAALEANDMPGAIDLAGHAIECGVDREEAGSLRLVQAEAHRWRGEHQQAVSAAQKALDAFPKRTDKWFSAAVELAVASSRIGDHDHVRSVTNALEGALRRTDAGPEIVRAGAQMAIHLVVIGRADRASQLGEVLEAAAARLDPIDPSVAARLELARSWRAIHAGRATQHLSHLLRAVELFEQAGDLRNVCKERVNLGFAYDELGLFAEAEAALTDALAMADRAGMVAVVATARQNLAIALARLGRLGEARAAVDEALAAFRAQKNRRMEAAAATTLCTILALSGDLAGAEAAARAAVEAASAPPDRCQALGALSAVQLALGRKDDALATASEAMELLESMGGIDEGEGLVRLAWAEALGMAGRAEAAKQAIRAARDRLLSRIGGSDGDPRLCRAFLEGIPEHARTMQLARAWLGEAP